MGTHSSNRTSQLVSRSVLAVALAVILVVAGAVAWIGLGDRIDDDATTQSNSAECLEGDAQVSVIADPGVAPALQEIAKSYNALRPTVRDYCIEMDVRPGDARATLDGLTAQSWDTEAGGPRPAAWIPESSVWVAALQTAEPDALQGAPESLVKSPVLFAVRPELATAAGGRVMWIQMPFLTYADAFAAYGHTAIRGSARLAMPQGPQSDATSLAAQGYVYNTVEPDGAGPLTVDGVGKPNIQLGLRQLMRNPPRAGDGSAEAAVRAIISAPNLDAAQVRSVPISEQRLYLATKDDDEARIAIIRPRGFTPMLDYPVIRLAGETPAHASDAVAEFLTFARKPEQMRILTQAGFRGAGPLPEATATVDFPDVPREMPQPEPEAVIATNRIVLRSAVPAS